MAREQAEHFCPEAKSAGDHAFDGGVEVGIGLDDDGIFAAHLQDDALDPELPGLRRRSSWMCRPTSLDPVKAIKRVCGCATMASPKLAPAPRQKFTTPSESRLVQQLEEWRRCWEHHWRASGLRCCH